MNIVRFFRGKSSNLVTCILEIIVGILLLINPEGFTSGIIIGAGVLLVLAGIVLTVRYFTTEKLLAAQSRGLFNGLVAAMAGLLCITQYKWFLSAFPLLTVLYAAVMLILAAAKVQKMADLCRLGVPRWYMPGVAAALEAILAVVILVNPFGAVRAVWTFAAISLIVEAVVEILLIKL